MPDIGVQRTEWRAATAAALVSARGWAGSAGNAVPVDSQATPAAHAHPRRTRILWRAAGFAALAALVYLFARRIDGAALGRALAQTRPGFLVLAAFLSLVQLVCRGNFFRTLVMPLADLPWLRAQRLTVTSSAAAAFLSGRAGDLLRAYALKREAGVPVAASVAVLGLEKVLDLTALFLVLAPVSVVLPGLPTWAARSLPWVAALALTLLFAAWVAASRARPPRWFAGFHAGLHIVRRPALLARALAECVVSWLCNLACLYAIMAAFGVVPSLGHGLLVLLATTVAVALPLTPGGLGTFQLGVVAALTPLGVPAEVGLAIGLLFHLTQVAPTAALAAVDGCLAPSP
jgi:uncharacterized membrane protein YbhN (UPF0104 family)